MSAQYELKSISSYKHVVSIVPNKIQNGTLYLKKDSTREVFLGKGEWNKTMNLSPAHYFERRILTTAPSITLKTRFPWEILATCMIMATSVFAMIWGFLTFPDLGIGASGLFGSSLIVIYYMLKERRKAWKVSGLS